MSAHEPGSESPAHSSSAPGRPTMTFMDVDKSGLSMSWRTVCAIIGVIVFGVVGAMVWMASLSTKADASAHNVSLVAHPVDLDDNDDTPAVPLPEAAKESVKKDATQDRRLDTVEAKAKDNGGVIVTVQNGFYEQRADQLGYKRVKQMTKNAPYLRKKTEFDRVKKRAVENQKSGKDIHDGLEDPAF